MYAVSVMIQLWTGHSKLRQVIHFMLKVNILCNVDN